MTRQSSSHAPADTRVETQIGLLQRKCTCGNTAQGLSGECEDGQREKAFGLQTKLVVGAADDPFEQEADRAASQVLGMPDAMPKQLTPTAPRLSRRPDPSPSGQVAPPSVTATLRRPGEPLPDATRAFFEPRFGHDFSRVRVHHDAQAAASARAVSAQAYTVGDHLVFAGGRYAPYGHSGRALLAHELAHVVQQSSAAKPVLRRAIFRQGKLTIDIDYGNVVLVPEADWPDRILALVAVLTGSAPAAAQEATIRGLAARNQRWLLFAFQLLSDNRAAATTLDWGQAVDHLVAHAPAARFRPLPDPDRQFVREVLRVSRWSETALAERLPAADVFDQAVAEAVVNPQRTTTQNRLKLREFNRRLPAALEHYLTEIDPANWTSAGTRSISAFQAIGDIVLEEARQFFAPYADAAAGNLFDLQPRWHASANIFDTNAQTPDADDRESYLLNRAELVGRATQSSTRIIDPNIFKDVHFDNQRGRDQRALLRVVHSVLGKSGMRARVDRIIQDTGRQFGTGTSTKIGIETQFDAGSLTACEDHWQAIGTMCHEVLHALVHPDFFAVSTRVSFPQVIREGTTEVLSVQLFNDWFLVKARNDSTFKARLEASLSDTPCPDPAQRTLGYGTAGQGAEEIRAQVGDDNFRAAYFLGKAELAGLPT
ncbi:MAG: DUF4157 domain-containing protein [Pseudomonadota bacterium]